MAGEGAGTAPVTVRVLDRAEAEARFDELARLRIRVFRDYPYLYDGDIAYERNYLAAYMESDGAVVIGALDGGRLVGAATAAPLTDHFEAFARPLAERGMDPRDFYYFGESVLERAYRGRGVGVRFFEEREKAARERGFTKTLFSAVIRPDDHPARPAGYVPLDRFWRARGYEQLEGLTTTFSWKDVGEIGESAKPMGFWTKAL